MPAERPAVFLDRDGVVNEDVGYSHRVEDFHFSPGVFDACRRFRQAGYLLVVVTNQAGIARGYYTENDFHRLTRWMCAKFEDSGAPLSAVYYCPHHPDASVAEFRMVCECRKPAPGLIIRAQSELSIDLRNSILVGDKTSDILAGQAAGVGRCYLITPTPPRPSSSPAHSMDTEKNGPSSLTSVADSLLRS
jgi:D-glycero-D-manno-heptose 1,7-bisphosphate phosphatase